MEWNDLSLQSRKGISCGLDSGTDWGLFIRLNPMEGKRGTKTKYYL